MKSFSFLSILIVFTGCASFSHQNKELSKNEVEQEYKGKATKIIKETRGKKEVLMILSLSGGGSRAAYFSGLVMLELQKEGLLTEVDVITSVSGGSLPAAYYAISIDPGDPNHNDVASKRIWDEKNVKDLMKRNYLGRWVANWFHPWNILRFWFTSYDRSDIMAQTFSDNMYDVKNGTRDLRFQDINEERPYLIINSTNATNKINSPDPYSSYFTFTYDDFHEIDSDINEFEIGRAVMASAAFPGVFNYVTLKNYNYKDKDRYIHVFDAGTRDNLGLPTVIEIITKDENDCKKYKHIIVILVDSYSSPKGISENKFDPREYFGHFIDMNILDAFSSLLESNRGKSIQELKRLQAEYGSKIFSFWHIEFDNVEKSCDLVNDINDKDKCLELSYNLKNKIPTSFKISNKDVQTIEDGVKVIFQTKFARENIDRIKEILNLSN